MKEWIPYVYIVKNKTTGLKYLGVRYAKSCHPDDLWKTYFTSSSLIKTLINAYGKEDFYVKVLHKYPNEPDQAILREAKYFSFIKERKDYLNACFSSGIIDLRINSKAGKVGGSIVRDKQLGIFRSEEERRKWASIGGKVGGKVQTDLGLGFHQYKNNPELHKEWASKGGKTSGQFQNKTFQSEMGKRGGIKNKGFVWINDGIKSYKYTKKQQDQISVEQFLLENTQFAKGRLR
jgi:general stress protein YciG